MYAKTLTAKELRKHIDELVQFVATARNGRRVRLLTCDKFPSYVDKQFVEDIRATHGIEMIVSPPYMPEKHPHVEGTHNRLQKYLRKMLLSLPGTKMLQDVMRWAPTDRRYKKSATLEIQKAA